MKEKDPNLSGEDVREGLTAVISVKLAEPQFEGQTKTKLGNPPVEGLVKETVNRKLGEFLEENPTDARADRLEVRRRRPRPRRRPQGARPHAAQVGARELDASRQARRLLGQGPARRRDLHRRGRLGRRLGQAGARPLDPGRAAAPRQDPERREEPDRQGALEHRDPGDDHGDRHRRPRGVRPLRSALPQDHPRLRRRRGRRPHPHARADLPLPPDARADRRRLRLHREAAALPREAGQPLALRREGVGARGVPPRRPARGLHRRRRRGQEDQAHRGPLAALQPQAQGVRGLVRRAARRARGRADRVPGRVADPRRRRAVARRRQEAGRGGRPRGRAIRDRAGLRRRRRASREGNAPALGPRALL